MDNGKNTWKKFCLCVLGTTLEINYEIEQVHQSHAEKNMKLFILICVLILTYFLANGRHFTRISYDFYNESCFILFGKNLKNLGYFHFSSLNKVGQEGLRYINETMKTSFPNRKPSVIHSRSRVVVYLFCWQKMSFSPSLANENIYRIIFTFSFFLVNEARALLPAVDL